MGAGIEFLNLEQIREQLGLSGLQDFVPAYGRLGAITDDTQMTLFTAEGLIRAWGRLASKGICHPPSVVHHAYLRWLLTQGERPRRTEVEIGKDGWLFATRALHERRAPGNTCLSALRDAEALGQPAIAKNNSKGCGGVMRVAPIGLFAKVIGDDAVVFSHATEIAALTHGHPSGSLSAGYFAVVISALMRGEPLVRALDAADNILKQHDDSDEVRRAIDSARTLAARGQPTPELLEGLGGGWTAEEALAIAICSSLVAKNFADGVLLAVNHSGDSDSTGSLAGNLLGAMLGVDAIPARWLDVLELREIIDRIATDLEAIVNGTPPLREYLDPYPPW